MKLKNNRMKAFLILTLLFNSAFAQKKKDNLLALPPLSYSIIKSVMFQNGYTLENDDTTYLTTTSKKVNNKSISIKLLFLRTDTSTLISALSRSTLSINLGYISTTPADFARLDFSGMRGSDNRIAWDEVVRLAKILSPEIKYYKQ